VRYKDKAIKFKEITYKAQGLVLEGSCWVPIPSPSPHPTKPKWRDKGELGLYLGEYGGRIKEDKRRRKGYLVASLTDDLIAEVPMDFAEKVLAFGFP